ncbi:MAG: GGDEF domain-containing protein [Acidobacteriota bacterium]
MAKILQHKLKKEKPDTSSIVDVGSTIKSSGLFGSTSAFIPTLTFLSGPALGKEIPLVHRELILGRGADCDFIIPDPSVSRKHLQISCRKVIKSDEVSTLKIVARDLGSRNGTLINYQPIRSAVLKPGDKIILGHVILKFDNRDIAERNFYDELYRLATTDSLTSLLNKAAIVRALSDEIAEMTRYRRRISVILVDIDEFKSLNDLYGHLVGDRILQCVAGLFRTNLRRRDKAGRFGGDEFLIILPETGLKAAFLVAERIRKTLGVLAKDELGLPGTVSASFGIASCSTNTAKLDELLECADKALYRAKSLGRNRAEICKGN